ncbi:MAG: transglutaminase-like putative cysteine protease [Oceanicoccus sp.]|jgi:transglutaminase-like putative cysteine protease
MSISWEIPRNCLAWILISQIALIIPHVQRLPWWVLAVYACCALWRVMVYQGRWSFPPKSIKGLFSILCFYGIYQSYGTMIGMEPTVALLISGFSLKLLEVVSRRDVYVILFLAYFVALTEFLFDQDFLVSAFVFFTVMLITTALVALHQRGYDRVDTISFRKTAVLFVQAVPLMVVLFIVFPRFEPLWKVPMPSHQAQSGVSDSMSPGDISDLAQSGDLAFRAIFESEIPTRDKLYWRGLVMSDFDGRTWRQGRLKKEFLSEEQERVVRRSLREPLRYSVIQEASHQPWLFNLALAYSTDENTVAVNDFRLVWKGDIHSRVKYEVISDIHAPIEPIASKKTRRYETELPFSGNPESRAFAQDLFAASNDERAFIDSVLTYYFREEFSYTLKPPLLGNDSIDDFLFNTKRGFCGHYASSFVFLMRSAGIPARVVSGYQGGEINPITGTILVHQFDAHAWAEVWLPDEGWVRFDPTSMISPERIEYGLEYAMQEEGSFLSGSPLSALRYRNVEWLNRLRLQLDAFSFYWSSLVLQYKGKRQVDLLNQLLGDISPFRVAGFILGAGALVLLSIAFFELRGRGRPKSSPEVQLYLRLCKRLERVGFERRKHEGPIDFSRRVTKQQTKWKPHVLSATRAFVTLSYEPLTSEEKVISLKLLKREVFKAGYLLRLDGAK